MKALYAICNHGIDRVGQELASRGIQTTLMLPDTDLFTASSVLFLTSVGKFNGIAEGLLDWDGVVIVFDCAVKCDHIKGMQLLDVKDPTPSYYYAATDLDFDKLANEIQTALNSDTEVIYVRKESNLLPSLLGQTSKSVLDRLQSWKYAIKDTTVRDIALDLVLNWIFTSDSGEDRLEQQLNELLPGGNKFAILQGEGLLTSLRAACADFYQDKLEGKTPNVDVIASRHTVSAFDIRYMYSLYTKRKGITKHEPAKNTEVIAKEVKVRYKSRKTGNVN